MNTRNEIKNVGKWKISNNRNIIYNFVDRSYFEYSTKDIMSWGLKSNFPKSSRLDMSNIINLLVKAQNNAYKTNGVINMNIIDEEIGIDSFYIILERTLKKIENLRNDSGVSDKVIIDFFELINSLDFPEEISKNYNIFEKRVSFGSDFIYKILSLFMTAFQIAQIMQNPNEDDFESIISDSARDWTIENLENISKGITEILSKISERLLYTRKVAEENASYIGDYGLVDWSYQWKNNYKVMYKIAQSYSIGYNYGVMFKVEDHWLRYPDLFVKTLDEKSNYVNLSPGKEFNFKNKIKINFSIKDRYRGEYRYLLDPWRENDVGEY